MATGGRFWKKDADDDFFSDEEEDFVSDEEGDNDDDNEDDEKNRADRWKAGGSGGDSSDEDSDQEKRVIRSLKDKRTEEMEHAIASLEAAAAANDWNKAVIEFDKLNKHVAKNVPIFKKNGAPVFYFKALIDLEDLCEKVSNDKEIKKKLSPSNSKSLNTLRQRLKKNNKQYEKQIEQYKKDPSVLEKLEEVEEEAPKEKQEKVEWSRPVIETKLTEVIAYRGKKNYDRTEQITKLEELSQQAEKLGNSDQVIRILFHVISAQFDMTNMASNLAINVWTQCFVNITRIMDLIAGLNKEIKEHGENDIVSPLEEQNEEIVSVPGNLIVLLERLDREYVSSLQNINAHTEEYVSRMQDAALLLNLAERVQKYYQAKNNTPNALRAALIRMSHLYYLPRTVKWTIPSAVAKNENANAEDEEEVPKEEEDEESSKKYLTINVLAIISELSSFVIKHGDARTRTHALLYQIYNLAVNEEFFQARDMMLMSHLQDNIHHTDISTQILFNRTMAQLGLCAFREGLIFEAHGCLSDICSSGKQKELLAQGMTSSRFTDKAPEQERLEKRRQTPPHMQINLDLLETVHLCSALLLEVPNMAANAYDVKRKVISKPFRRLLDYFDRQVFTGPPENTRDCIVAAARALMSGDWKKTVDILLNLKAWDLIPNSDFVKAMLRRKIQEEGLRTYLFTYSQYYDSLGLNELSAIFELTSNTVHSIISKMMINEELHASWDQPTASIVMHKVEPTRLQALSLQFSEKASIFVENNERLMDYRSGGYAGGYVKSSRDGQHGQSGWTDRSGQYGGGSGYDRRRGQGGSGSGGGGGGGYRRDRDQQQRGQGGSGSGSGGGYQQQQGGRRGRGDGNYQSSSGGGGGYRRSGPGANTVNPNYPKKSYNKKGQDGKKYSDGPRY